MPLDDLALLRLELDALWVRDEVGRLRHCRTPDEAPAPLLVVAAGRAGAVWAASAGLSEGVHARLADLLDDEPPADELGWSPRRADDLVRALAGEAPPATAQGGPSWVVPAGLAPPPGVDLGSSAGPGADELRGRVPEPDRSLTAPWVVALVAGEVAAVCETARSAPGSVEAGVWTYEPHRRRGLATAVTAAWSAHVTERAAFYSTSWDNAASQGVARRLGLRPLGQWWQLHRPGEGSPACG